MKKQIYLLYAYGNLVDGVIQYHTVRGSVQMNFEDGVILPSPYKIDFRVIHACFMVIAWAFLVVPSMIFSRYFKIVYKKWFQLHWILNVVALLMAYMALILVLICKELENKKTKKQKKNKKRKQSIN